MKFCNKCDNMYYIRVSDDDGNSLTYYCRNCGNEETNIQDNICVSKTNLKRQWIQMKEKVLTILP